MFATKKRSAVLDDNKLVEMRRALSLLPAEPSSSERRRRAALLLFASLAAAALAEGCGSASSDTLTGPSLTTTTDGSYPLDLRGKVLGRPATTWPRWQ